MTDNVTVAMVAAVPATIAALGALLAALSGRRHARSTSAKVDGVTHELNPNSGGSLRDAVDRIEAAQADQGARLVVLERAAEKRRPRGMWRR